jgi:serine/threonine protein kinase/tetratricopeptide (TPR) repeat protein
MKSFLASARSQAGLDRVDRDVRSLEEEWQREGDVSLDRFWQDRRNPGDDPGDSELVRLSALIKADLRCRFERGQTPAVTEYLANFPELRQVDSRVISLIYEEYCLLEERGHSPDVASFCDRYPAWRDSLVSQLQYHRLFSQAAGFRQANPRYPEVGEKFEEYELVALIGKGGSSRVFLANDISLGGKRVVLKVSLDKGQEPKTQGALDHPHIVPVNSVAFHFMPEYSLRGLSMPYRAGLPLDEVIKRVQPARKPRQARDLWDALVAGTADGPLSVSAPEREALPRRGPAGDGWAGFPARGTFAQGVAWIGMILARTLHYAHGMRTFHRDVKPGNVLLTLHHGPQLLDFNLAESPHAAQHAESAMLGGTLPYMAPEQIEAFLNPDLWGTVGARADIYSLGLVLRELLTGQAPDVPDDHLPPARALRDLLDRRSCLTTDVRHDNPEIPHALAAIVRRCLAFRPEDRYPDGHALAGDLERFLSRKPLAHVANPSRRERLANWTTRNGRSLAVTACTIALGMVLGILAAPSIRDQMKPGVESNPAFGAAKRAVDEGRYGEAFEMLTRLKSDYPNDFLPQWYLAIAHSGLQDVAEDAASLSYREAMALPGGAEALSRWAAREPMAAQHLERLGNSWIRNLDVLFAYRNTAAASATAGTSSRSDPTEASSNYARGILHVLELARSLDPSSGRSLVEIATAEEILGEYDSAYKHLSEQIEKTEAQDDFGNRIDLTNWVVQRGRVAVKIASSLRGTSDPGRRDEALSLLRRTAKELDRYGAGISHVAATPLLRVEESLAVFKYFRVKIEVLLNLAEAELSDGRPEEAVRQFGKAGRTLNSLVESCRVGGYPMPHADEDTLRKWCRTGLDRARKARAAADARGRNLSPDPHQPPPGSTLSSR